ncbi:hypothetical protein K437DRAFT_84934 [Tilletiaria anomala UBC 951]|uniref:Uncharacterized protein n=1 Tax=Tilletiaria anomala (strain ATCC 24038 / CBS 436.72 / UBC 951) TaxID=1037660 RepID=A0A066WBR9_TILAU|nr:uncharacterized protein K437DRAFT_84934 [Tilletiaria anomala UBC 951]KDN48544.1 hypothetical protein K437DRAFT_84934 [Tilletiaria anomala UBC 951]
MFVMCPATLLAQANGSSRWGLAAARPFEHIWAFSGLQLENWRRGRRTYICSAWMKVSCMDAQAESPRRDMRTSEVLDQRHCTYWTACNPVTLAMVKSFQVSRIKTLMEPGVFRRAGLASRICSKVC